MDKFPGNNEIKFDEINLEDKFRDFLTGIGVKFNEAPFQYMFHLKQENRAEIVNRVLKSGHFTKEEKDYISSIS